MAADDPATPARLALGGVEARGVALNCARNASERVDNGGRFTLAAQFPIALGWSGDLEPWRTLTLIALPAAIVIAWVPRRCRQALIAGVVIDRYPRRPLMIGANIVRWTALASLPAAFALQDVALAPFFPVSFVVGVASAVFDTAYPRTSRSSPH